MSVAFSGQVAEDDLPRYYAAGDVFAMPCRTRLGGLEVEGWGNVFIEAAACGKPVVVGDSGGARESLVDGETGILVDGTRVDARRRCGRELVGGPRAGPGHGDRRARAGPARTTPGRRSPSVWPHGWARPRAPPRPGKARSFASRGGGRGYPARVSNVERRCPNCNALVSEDADWCGQCFADLRAAPAAASGATRRRRGARARLAAIPRPPPTPKGDPFWPCSVCGAHNPIVLEVCETCGTPFAAVMRGVTKR